jgi:membrane protein DedA with SNARE-associated domain
MTVADEGGIAGWAVGLMETLGGPGAGLAIALENLFPPLPSEVILPLAGFAASRGELSLAGALFWTTVGSVVGALLLYALGGWFGRDRVRAVAARLPLVKLSDIDRTEAWFARHGAKAVFFGRMIPIFRSVIPLPDPQGEDSISPCSPPRGQAQARNRWNVSSTGVPWSWPTASSRTDHR